MIALKGVGGFMQITPTVRNYRAAGMPYVGVREA